MNDYNFDSLNKLYASELRKVKDILSEKFDITDEEYNNIILAIKRPYIKLREAYALEYAAERVFTENRISILSIRSDLDYFENIETATHPLIDDEGNELMDERELDEKKEEK